MDDAGAYILFWLFIGAVVGGLIGSKHNQVGSGVVWGALLGPIGWIITLVLPDARPKCPECRGAIPEDARRCQHCGFVFGEAKLQNPSQPSSAPISDRSRALKDQIAALEAEVKKLESQLQRAPAPTVAPSTDVETESKTEGVQSKASAQLAQRSPFQQWLKREEEAERETSVQLDSEPQQAIWVTCTCNVCSGKLEFEAVHAGTTIQCPHCGMDTILFTQKGS